MGAFEGAVINHEGFRCAIVVVAGDVVREQATMNHVIASFSREVFGGIPTVLMSTSASGKPAFFGEPQLVLRIAQLDPRRIPWKKFNITLRA